MTKCDVLKLQAHLLVYERGDAQLAASSCAMHPGAPVVAIFSPGGIKNGTGSFPLSRQLALPHQGSTSILAPVDYGLKTAHQYN